VGQPVRTSKSRNAVRAVFRPFRGAETERQWCEQISGKRIVSHELPAEYLRDTDTAR